MLDIEELDDSLKLKAIGRLFVSKHPLLKLLCNKINHGDFFFPKFDDKLDKFIAKGIRILGKDRIKLLKSEGVNQSVKLIGLLRSSKISNWIKPECANSIRLLSLRVRGIVTLGQIAREDLQRLRPIVRCQELLRLVGDIRGLDRVPIPTMEDRHLYPISGKLKNLSKCSSKEIRINRQENEQTCVFKIGLILNVTESKTWLYKIRKLTSVRHRNLMLRIAHGDVYSNERKFRFGLVESPDCTRCGNVDTTTHKLFECEALRDLWRETMRLTCSLNPGVDPIQLALGATLDTTIGGITLLAEVLDVIMNGNLIGLGAVNLLRLVVNKLKVKERNVQIKSELYDMSEKLEER